MIKFQVPIKGMHCRSCELLIEESLKEIDGVKSVHASTKENIAEVVTIRSISKNEIISAVKKAGYEVGIEEKPVVSKNPQVYKELLTAFFILVSLYMLAQVFGLNKFATSNNAASSNLLVVFTIGLTAGMSTCMALVGGLILGVSARHTEKHPTATPFQNFRPHLFFSLGRVLSYFILGGVIGQIGSVFKLSGPTLGAITIAVGIIMLYLGLGLIDIFPNLSSGPTLPKFVTKLFRIKRREEKEYSHTNALVLGALTFFLPCGFTQAMQVLAISSGNFFSGALIMGVFALGTTPGLLTIGGLTSLMKKGYLSRLFFKFVGLLVIALSIFNLSNGLSLTGLKPYLFSSNSSSENTSNVKEENGVQIVRMDQTAYGYNPKKLTIKAGVPVKWVITSKDISTCASSIIVPKLGIQKVLRLGENTIEFTVKDPGKISFSCSMGMYTGYFDVVGNSSSLGSTSDKTTGSNNNNPTVVIPTKPSASDGPLRADTQILKATYDTKDYIQPNSFSVRIDKPVRLEIAAKEDGAGCMSSVMIPGIDNTPQYMEKGQTAVFEFTPDKLGTYQITCAMGITFGKISVS